MPDRIPPNCTLLPAVDVLVLGAGLAGLRAALAALAAAPGTAVAVAATQSGPSGSSFSNMHGRLGLHAPETDAACEAFCREAAAVAVPGFVVPGLVAALAAEALPRRLELEAWGAAFARDAAGRLLLFPSCFSPDSRRATLLTDLPELRRLLWRRIEAAGGRALAGMTALACLREPGGRACGALFEDATGNLTLQPAGAVVAAMGGTAPLFLRHQAGGGNPGFGHGLLALAGARMANTAFHQWMWARVRDRRFWPVWSLLKGAAAADAPLPEAVREAGAGRAGHCPFGYGQRDAALDLWLLDRAGADGVASVTHGGERLDVALFAHAANGGAVVDARGRTDVPALFAVGECATGMHGANRLGGAMVASCLVFGARAGETAAREAARPGEASFARAVAASRAGFARDRAEEREVTGWLAHTLQQYAVPRRNPDAAALSRVLGQRLETVRDAAARVRLAAAGRLKISG
ncbi:FAD-binding protein [Solidesulfovibrio alcoholivorans]|uniref:FAD-binding protein n=1 Tax=Solidesulfovibrio alcoholivorans TaxID=81406 RepID=UPI0004967254|nr:FAD-binding protein [Solidesulfovibrio alcoholivorans]